MKWVGTTKAGISWKICDGGGNTFGISWLVLYVDGYHDLLTLSTAGLDTYPSG